LPGAAKGGHGVARAWKETEMAEAKIKIGKKGDKDKVDQKKIGKGKKPSQRDVEGQYQYWSAVSCWNCWSVNEVVIDTQQYLGYWCWQCGAYFEV
jgi:hypothetical protein